MRVLVVALMVFALASPVCAETPRPVDYIFELAQDKYADIPKGDCLVQQMCVSEEDRMDCFELYIFNDGSVAMLPWDEPGDSQ